MRHSREQRLISFDERTFLLATDPSLDRNGHDIFRSTPSVHGAVHGRHRSQNKRSRAFPLRGIHGYGSSGEGGVLCSGIRRSLRLRVKEGRAVMIIPGERFSSDANETRLLLQRYPVLRRDRDLNRSNPGVTIVELAPQDDKSNQRERENK